MFAMISSLVFVTAAAVAVAVVFSTFRENRDRIADALHGRPLSRV